MRQTVGPEATWPKGCGAISFPQLFLAFSLPCFGFGFSPSAKVFALSAALCVNINSLSAPRYEYPELCTHASPRLLYWQIIPVFVFVSRGEQLNMHSAAVSGSP